MISIQLLLIVIAISFDSFMIGITFGIKKVNVHAIAFLIIFGLSASIVYIAMTFGTIVEKFISSLFTDLLGSAIFMILGCILLRANNTSETTKDKSFTQVERFDRDASKHISIKESFLLGIFLALDSFGAGFGAAFFQYDKIFTAIFIGFASVCLLFSGLLIGKFSTKNKTVASLSWMPPLILIAIGIYHFVETIFL